MAHQNTVKSAIIA